MSEAKPVILAIDDTPANLLTLGSALASEFDLRISTSGGHGLELAATIRPDLILLDVMMPEMDGFEVCRRLSGEVDADAVVDVAPFWMVVHAFDGGDSAWPPRAGSV